MLARIERLREGAVALATAFHQPDKIEELYPRPLPSMKAVKWWGGGE